MNSKLNKRGNLAIDNRNLKAEMDVLLNELSGLSDNKVVIMGV